MAEEMVGIDMYIDSAPAQAGADQYTRALQKTDEATKKTVDAAEALDQALKDTGRTAEEVARTRISAEEDAQRKILNAWEELARADVPSPGAGSAQKAAEEAVQATREAARTIAEVGAASADEEVRRASDTAQRAKDAAVQGAQEAASQTRAVRRRSAEEERAEFDRWSREMDIVHRQRQERRALQDAAAARHAARERAQQEMEAAEAEYRRMRARIKAEQAAQLLSPAEARRAAEDVAREYNETIQRVLSEGQSQGAWAGTTGANAYAQVAGSIKEVGAASKNAVPGVSRLGLALTSMARQALGVNPVLAQAANLLSTFALGSVVTVGVMAGLAAVGYAWRKYSEEARKSREETAAAVDSLKQLRDEALREADPAAEWVERLETARRRITEINVQIRREMAAGGPGLLSGVVKNQAILDLEEEMEDLLEVLEHGEKKILDILTSGAEDRANIYRDNLVALVASGTATSTALDEANRRLEVYTKERNQLLAEMTAIGILDPADLAELKRLQDLITAIGGAITTQEERAAREREKARKDAEAYAASARDAALELFEMGKIGLDALGAMGGGAEIVARELGTVFERLEWIQRALDSETLSLERQLELVRERLRIQNAIAKAAGEPEIELAGAGSSLTYEGGGRFGLRFDVGNALGVALRELDAHLGPLADRFVTLSRRSQVLADSTEALGGTVDALIEYEWMRIDVLQQTGEAILSLNRTFDFLSDGAASAAAGVVDIGRGVRALQEIPSDSGGLAKWGGIAIAGASVVGGILSIGDGLLSSSRAARDRIQQAESALTDALDAFFADASGNIIASDARAAVGVLDATLDSMFAGIRLGAARAIAEESIRSADVIATAMGAASLNAVEAIEAIEAAANALDNEKLREVGAELRRRLDELVQAMERDLEIRRVAATEGAEAADALRLQIRYERELADARAHGLEALFEEVWALEKDAIARKKRADEDAEAEKARQAAHDAEMQRIEQRGDFMARIGREEARLAGGDALAIFDALASYNDGLSQATQLFEDGIISLDDFNRAVEVITDTLGESMAAVEASNQAAADAILAANASLEEQISLMWLSLEGRDEEVYLLQRDIEYRKELNQLIAAGIDPELIERWTDAWNAATEEGLEGIREAERGADSRGGATRRTGTSSGRLDVGGVTEAAVYRTNDILFSMLSVLQDIAASARSAVSGGGVAGAVGAGGSVEFSGPLTVYVGAGVEDSGYIRSSVQSGILEVINRGLGQESSRDERLRGGRLRR